MSQYHLVDTRAQLRVNCDSLGDMVSRWLDDPRRIMTTVLLDPIERSVVERLVAMRDELDAVKRERASMAASVMRRAYASEEGVVL